jgi:hypothetical protein
VSWKDLEFHFAALASWRDEENPKIKVSRYVAKARSEQSRRDDKFGQSFFCKNRLLKSREIFPCSSFPESGK